MFVLVIGMAYRYLFLLLGSVTDMYEARKARTVGAVRRTTRPPARSSPPRRAPCSARPTTSSEEVHQAMVARGYRGDATTVQTFRIDPADVVFVVAASSCGR